MVAHVSLTNVTRVGFRLLAVTYLKLTLSHARSVLSIMTPSSIAGILRVVRFPAVVTLEPWGMALTGPLGRTAQEAYRVIQNK